MAPARLLCVALSLFACVYHAGAAPTRRGTGNKCKSLTEKAQCDGKKENGCVWLPPVMVSRPCPRGRGRARACAGRARARWQRQGAYARKQLCHAHKCSALPQAKAKMVPLTRSVHQLHPMGTLPTRSLTTGLCRTRCVPAPRCRRRRAKARAKAKANARGCARSLKAPRRPAKPTGARPT